MKVAMLVSGGVDSSLAAALLKEQGHDITAFYLKIWLEDELAWLNQCPWQEDLQFVTALCDQLNIPLQQINLQQEYWQEIVGYTIANARLGLTPNPDILCNAQIKFGCFLKHIDHSFDKVATGHYAQVVKEQDRFLLKSAPDKIKDQTYFLARLEQAQLQRALFPIGHLTKAQVRQMAAERNLPSKDRHDSQGLCFLGKLKFHDFLKFYLGEKPGQLVELETNQPLGKHPGCWFFTYGQRHGMGLSGGPWYVVKKDVTNNIVYISKNYHSSSMQRDRVWIKNCHWFTNNPPVTPCAIGVKLRHGPERYVATLNLTNETGQIQLPCNDQGIAPGQFAVFYQQDLCIGSAIIDVPAI